MIRLYRVDNLPPGAPAAVFKEGDTVVVLVSGAHVADPAWTREVANTLLGEACSPEASRLSKVV